MPFCSNCGSKMPDGSQFCTNCGTPMAAAPAAQNAASPQPVYQQPAYQQPVYQQPAYQQPVQAPQTNDPPLHNNGGMMAWSIITLFLSLLFGAIAISQVRKANKAATRTEELECLGTAKTWNIIGDIIGVLGIIGTLSQQGYL